MTRALGIPKIVSDDRQIVYNIKEMGKMIENYSLQQMLGEGVYGKVYKGVHMKTKQEVAIKVIKADKFREIPKLEECTINEINILSKIEGNPHIVRYLDMLKTINNFYFVYEFCNGGTLQKVMSSHRESSDKVFPTEKIVIYFGQILDAFKTLTKLNIMHRDLKPDNILLHNGIIKIADFGFSKMLKSPTDLAQTMLGSPIYMAPEVINGDIYTMKADIWSLGVVLYEMVFGFCPFQSKSIAKLIQILQSDEVKFPFKPPAVIENILRRMLVKDPAKRIDWAEIFEYRITESGEIFEPQNSKTRPKNQTTQLLQKQAALVATSPSGQRQGSNFLYPTKSQNQSNSTSSTGNGYRYLGVADTSNQVTRKSPHPRDPVQTKGSQALSYKYSGPFVDSHSQLTQLIKNHRKISFITKLSVDVMGKFPKQSLCLAYILSKSAQKELNDILDSLSKDWASEKNLRMDKTQQEAVKIFKQMILEELLDLETPIKMLKDEVESMQGDATTVSARKNRYLKQFVKAYSGHFNEDQEAIIMVFQLLDFFEESILLKADSYKRLTKEQLLKQINSKLDKLN